MPWNLLAVPLLAGYWFIYRTAYVRQRILRLGNQALLLHSAFFGLGFGAIARLLVVVLEPRACEIADLWYQFAPEGEFPNSGTAALEHI